MKYENCAPIEAVQAYLNKVEEVCRKSDELITLLEKQFPGDGQTVLSTLDVSEREIFQRQIIPLSAAARRNHDSVGPANPSYLPTETEMTKWTHDLQELEAAVDQLTSKVRPPH